MATNVALGEYELIKKAKVGDREAFKHLILLYQNRIYNYCRLLLHDNESARDITQEAFTRALAALERFNLESDFKPWIYRIARNLALDWIKKKSSKEFQIEPEKGDLQTDWSGSYHETPFDEAYKSELRGNISKELSRLPLHYREALIMKHYEELSYEEMSEITGLPVNPLRIRVMRARRLMQESLARKGLKDE